jgi:hypothetical protein
MSMALGQAGGLQASPLRVKAGCLNNRVPNCRIRRQRQRLTPQALAFGGLAPAGHNLQTELEALETLQGAPQQVLLLHCNYREAHRGAALCCSCLHHRVMINEIIMHVRCRLNLICNLTC